MAQIRIRCGIRENAKKLYGILDLTAPWEAGFAKIWVRDAGFFSCLSFVKTENLIVAHISIDVLQKLLSACFRLKNMERKNKIRNSGEKSAGFGILVKNEWECGIRTPCCFSGFKTTARNVLSTI